MTRCLAIRGCSGGLKVMVTGERMSVTWRLDRRGQAIRKVITTVVDLDEEGVELQSLKESIKTTAPGGQHAFHVFGVVAELERSSMHDRTRASLEAARQHRAPVARPSSTDEKPVPVRMIIGRCSLRSVLDRLPRRSTGAGSGERSLAGAPGRPGPAWRVFRGRSWRRGRCR